ncbi:MAG: hydroxymethylbilane synthase [Microthrixaceae bacterium]
MGNRLRIATRASALAVWQAEHVAAILRAAHPSVEVELVSMTTEGDRRLDVPLSEIGGKGVFATEVQAALLDGRADVAVHSAKDLPARTPAALLLAAVPERGDSRDALVGATLDGLAPGAVVATGSARRRALLADLRSDLRFAELRGNMATRLAKAADFDAIVVAAVAFERLGLGEHLRDVLAVDSFVPQVAQGALGVECRADDAATAALLRAIEHAPSRRRVEAERAFLAELGGDCTLPAGAHAVVDDDGGITLYAALADRVGGTLLRRTGALGAEASVDALHRLGRDLAAELRAGLDGAGA